MRIPVAKEGFPFIVVTLAALALVLLWAGANGGAGRWAASGVLAGVACFVIGFFRDPERRTPPDDGLVLSAADGTVQSIGPAEDPQLPGRTYNRVTIFLSIFNVHVQRAPLAGRVNHYSYRPGSFLPAWREEASTGNERASLGITTPAGPILVRQIAGLVARRIATYPRVEDRLDQGERIGLIRFGSRVDIFLPVDWPVEVGVGDSVRGGLTPIARVAAGSLPERKPQEPRHEGVSA